ncbi:MAG: DUF4352 domain-containing protein [Mobilitalea sp.]
MKRLRLGLLILLTLSLTGCIQKYSANEQQSDAAAEYFADLLLESDKNYDQSLIAETDLTTDMSIEEVEEEAGGEADPITTEAIQSDTNVNTAQDITPVQKEYSIAEIVGNTDFVIDYSGFEVAYDYPEDSENAYFTMTPNKGNQFLFISFTITNNSSKKQTLDFNKADINYLLSIGKNNQYEPLFTVLENDMHYLKVTLEKGKSKEVLLAFEIPNDINISNMSLEIFKNDKTKIIEIK